MTDDANHPHSLATLERMFWGDRGQVNELRTWHDRGLTASSILFADADNPQDGPVHLKGATAPTDLLTARIEGDAEPRFVINADGSIEWGSGAAVPDIDIQRTADRTLYFHRANGDRGLKMNIGSSSTNFTWEGTGGTDGILLALSLAAAHKPLVAKGAASQTANLQEWQDSAGTVLSRITSSGQLGLGSASGTIPASGLSTGDKIGLFGSEYGLGIQSGALVAFVDTGAGFSVRQFSASGARSSGSNGIRLMPGAAQILFGAAEDTNLYRSAADNLKTDDTLTALKMFAGSGLFGGGGQPTGARNALQAAASTDIAAVVKGAASQSANLQEWQDSAGTVLAWVNQNGNSKFRGVQVASDVVQWTLASSEQTTVGAAGAADALPANPTKYLKVKDSAGATLVIPAYAAA